MIVDIVQTKTNFNMEWKANTKGKEIAVGVAPFIKGKFQVQIDYEKGRKIDLYYNPLDTTWGTKMTDRLSFKIFEANELIGKIVGATKKTGFLKAYAYYDVTFEGKQYYAYEVGFGSKGLYLCIYRDEQLIAIIDKALKVVNFKDTYKAFIKNDSDFDIVILFTIYYDATSYGDVMEIAVLSLKEKRVNTIQKELISKFDQSFIDTIKAEEMISE